MLGNPVSVYDKTRQNKEEAEFVKKIMQENKKIIGICAGAQMIAHVLGKEVYKNKVKEEAN